MAPGKSFHPFYSSAGAGEKIENVVFTFVVDTTAAAFWAKGKRPVSSEAQIQRLAAAGITAGPVFRAIDRHGNMSATAIADRTVARVVKRSILAAALADGMTATQARAYVRNFAGHSLRRGLATSAAANDAPPLAIQRQLRHRKADTTNGYIESGRLFRQNAAGFAGL